MTSIFKTRETARKIVTKYDPPPIPWRGADWTATYAEYDLGDPIGQGETEAEAIDDLRIEEEMLNG